MPDSCLPVDLISGGGKRCSRCEYPAKTLSLDELSLRTHLIRAAKDVGLLAVQRLFALDSEGVKTGRMMRSAEPMLLNPAGLVLPHLAERLPVDAIPVAELGGDLGRWRGLQGPALG